MTTDSCYISKKAGGGMRSAGLPTPPGEIVLTRIFGGPNSMARVLVIAITPLPIVYMSSVCLDRVAIVAALGLTEGYYG